MPTQNDILPYAKLMHNIHNPDMEEVWLEGYEDGQADITEDANPYPVESTLHQYWIDGWWGAFYGEEPLFDSEGNHAKASDVIANIKQSSAIPKQIRITQAAANKKSLRFGRLIIQILAATFVGAVCYELAT